MFTKIKSLFMVLILAGFTAQYATAESFNQEDMAFVFGDSAIAASDFGQMDLLSSQEMVATEGELLPVYAAVFAARFAYTGYKVWRATRSGAQIYSRGLHKAHHNFGTRANPSWRYHYQWTTSKGSFRVPYGNHYLYKNRPDLGYRSTWFRR